MLKKTEIPQAIVGKAKEMLELLSEWSLKLITLEMGSFEKELSPEERKEFEELLLCAKRAITAITINNVSLINGKIPHGELDDFMFLINRMFAVASAHVHRLMSNRKEYMKEGAYEYICPHDDIIEEVKEMLDDVYRKKEKEHNDA